MTGFSRWAAGAAVLALLAGCDNGSSAVETRDRAEGAQAATPASAPTTEARDVGVKPAITTARDDTVDAKVRRLFERNGAAFGAASPEDYLTKAKVFIDSPPTGTETVKRANGDILFYQASSNTFAVADRDGVLRTMFKPDDGPAYWAEQKESAPTFGQRRG